MQQRTKFVAGLGCLPMPTDTAVAPSLLLPDAFIMKQRPKKTSKLLFQTLHGRSAPQDMPTPSAAQPVAACLATVTAAGGSLWLGSPKYLPASQDSQASNALHLLAQSQQLNRQQQQHEQHAHHHQQLSQLFTLSVDDSTFIEQIAADLEEPLIVSTPPSLHQYVKPTEAVHQLQQQQQLEQLEQLEQETRDDPFELLKLLFSGAMAAVVSRSFVAPLERVKMELVLKQSTGGALATALRLYQQEGISGFWKGNALNLLRTAPFKAVNFLSFELYHRAFTSLAGDDGNLQRFAAGAGAGVTATMTCFPLDVIRTRLLSTASGPRYGGPFKTLMGMFRNEGVGALYTGVLPAVIGMAPAGAVFYGVYDLLKHRHLDSLDAAEVGQHTSIPAVYTLLYGAAAGAASELIVYPLEVVRRRMQIQCMAAAAAKASASALQPGAAAAAGAKPLAASAASTFATLLATCMAIVRTDGIRGFYSGMVPNLLQVLPSAALSYYTYDTFKNLLVQS